MAFILSHSVMSKVGLIYIQFVKFTANCTLFFIVQGHLLVKSHTAAYYAKKRKKWCWDMTLVKVWGQESQWCKRVIASVVLYAGADKVNEAKSTQSLWRESPRKD